jgi:hypothetical protein
VVLQKYVFWSLDEDRISLNEWGLHTWPHERTNFILIAQSDTIYINNMAICDMVLIFTTVRIPDLAIIYAV